MKFIAINLDFYGTLVDWLQIWIKVANQIINENCIQISPEQFALEWRKIQRQMLENEKFIPYKENISLALFELCKKYRVKNNNYDKLLFDNWENIKPFPEVVPTLKKLKTKYKLTICTNSSRDLFDICVKKIPIEFDNVFISDETKVNKPHKKMYQIAINALELTTKNILHVASSQMDVKGAKNAGLVVCWINRLNEEKLTKTPNPAYEIRKFDEILRIL